MTVRIVTDSTCDLPHDTVERLGITVVPLTIFFGDEALLDGVELEAQAFYERLQGLGPMPRTSQPSVDLFQDAYERLSADGSEIVSIHLSSKLSGTLNAASVAREVVKASAHVDLIDSYQVSVGLGLIVMEAAIAAQAGKGLAEVVAAARRAMDRTGVYVVVDTLEFLRRGGRLGRARSFLGSILSIKPILHVEDGEVAPLERVRTRARAVERLYQLALQHPRTKTLFVGYGGESAQAELLAERLRPALPHTEILLTELGPAVGVHTGPGSLGIAYLERE
ncbi:MAG: DegV family protein [Tepidiformaceae bacterium]